jgi:Tripartite tricarboxylate transporter TctB family
MKKYLTQDQWTAVTCIVIAVLFALSIPSQTSHKPLPGARGFDLIDGAFFPEIAVILFALAAVWLFFDARARRPEARPDVVEGMVTRPQIADEVEPPGMTFRDLAWAIALSSGVLFYVQLLHPLGYLPATILGVLVLAYICGQRSLLGFVTGGVVFPTALYYLFTRLFMVPLPRGDIWSGW